MDTDIIDLSNDNFMARLGKLLEHLSFADFVAIDFELSGIPTRLQAQAQAQANEQTNKDAKQGGKPTVQQRYDEMRAAAEKFGILQVGITLGSQSEGGYCYFLEPYNISLNPSIIHKMDIDREITMLGSSMQFLAQNNFHIDRPFIDGVPYLSRDEHRRAIEIESNRLDGKGFVEIGLDPKEKGHQEFIDRTRANLRGWKPKGKDDSYTISGGSGPVAIPLSSFQRALVHQLVRTEFPKLVTTVVQGCIRVIPLDPQREEKIKKQRMEAFMTRISKQAGFRWVMESLVGGDLSDLDPSDLYMHADKGWLDMTKVRKDMGGLVAELKARRPVLVGHNMFMDLVFMYRTFYGPLPEKVGDFAKAIHELFPLIIDTKFLCTHTGDTDNTSLDDLTRDLNHQEKPQIYTRPGHRRYETTISLHEAGYDSWQTARLLVKTAAKLVSRTQWQRAVKKATKGGTSRPLRPGTYVSTIKSGENLIELEDVPVFGPSLHEYNKKARAYFAPDAEGKRKEDDQVPADILPLELFHMLPKPVDPEAADPYKMPEPSPNSVFLPQWMPAWDSDFWLLFGNKIRIHGTQEALLDLLAKNEKARVEE